MQAAVRSLDWHKEASRAYGRDGAESMPAVEGADSVATALLQAGLAQGANAGRGAGILRPVDETWDEDGAAGVAHYELHEE